MFGYLAIGQNVLLPEAEIVGVFDLDNTSWSVRTREFLERAQREGRVRAAGEDLPRSFVLCQSGDGPTLVRLSTFSTRRLHYFRGK